ncbi:hypothetical protein C2G38_2157663 [Gigaspora rosea]|uniref:MULE transposase domain-containing protein n=1 Tax=Gigaspora rosea TaxID=44941 RepID=A0A397W5H2_9GLOM|nr:hypothetical protein C2G38_2157663 [Gigaspora rosea]
MCLYRGIINIKKVDNTNKMNLELYFVFAEVDGIGFPLAYMLLTTTTTINNGTRTNMITQFFNSLYHRGISPVFIIIDKNSAQILVAKTI